MLTVELEFKPLSAINMNNNLNVNHIKLLDTAKNKVTSLPIKLELLSFSLVVLCKLCK